MGKTVGNLDKHIQIDLSNFSVNGHTHNYVPLSGGTMTGNLKFSDVTSTTYPAKSAMLTWNGSTDGADIYYQVDASDKGRLVLNTRDDADCVIAFANKGTIVSTIDANGNFSGKAAKADTLNTARTLTIGNTGKTFNGSANVDWSLSEIGAAASNHTHTQINTRGKVTCESGATGRPAANGLSMSEAYNNGYPTTYGNVINLRGQGDGQILVGWSATDGAHAPVYVRSKRDNTSTANWSSWAQIYTTAHKPTPADIGAAASSHGTHVTYATATPKAHGKEAVGTSAKVAREDHVHPLQTSVAQLTIARTINGTNFDGSANITTANWGTARKINQISVNGSADVKLPLDYYTCNIGNSNAKPYHHILTTGRCTGDYTDKSITIVLVNHYNGAGLGIAKATLRTNQASTGDTASGELRWLVRSGFAENSLCFNIRNTAKDAYMDVFYKSNGTYASLIWYVLTEGGRGNHSSQWTKYNTSHDNGTNVYNEAGMKAIRTYTSTLQSATDNGAVNSAKTAAACSGNAATATKLQTAKTITIGNAGKSFDGSANIGYTLADIGAAASNHTHNYLPLSGGTLTGNLTISNNNKNLIIGTGSSDVYIYNSASGKYFQMKDDGTLSYSSSKIYHAGDKPTASEVGALATSGGTMSGNITLNNGKGIYGKTGEALKDLEGATVAAGTSGGLLVYNGSHNLHLGALVYDKNLVTGSTYLNGAVNMFVRTNKGYVAVQPERTSTMTFYKTYSNTNVPLRSTVSAGTYLAGNQGTALLNSTASAGSYVTVAKTNSTNGYFTLNSYQQGMFLSYTAKSTVDAGTNAVTKTVKLIDEAGNTQFPGTVTASAFSGNATSATTLATARTINGTSFNGSANITTANWGTARTLTIGNKAQSVNGGRNVTWSLADIGAEVATATHSTVDITSSGFTSKGTKKADTMASTGNCYSLASTTSSLVLASGNFNAVKFGKYALCLRIMSSNNTSTANILTVTVKHGSTTLLTKNIKGTDFTSTSQYSNIYTSFDFNGTSSARGTLSVQISTGTTSGITFKFDYAYITLMTPSVFI